jgi:DNA-binding response OmpR family regulator
MSRLERMDSDTSEPRVLLVEPNAPLRAAVVAVLKAEQYRVQVCASLEDVLVQTDGHAPTVALVAWQSMNGLLAEEHRHALVDLTRRIRLIVMMPRHWAKLLEQTDVVSTVAGIVAKPFEADELLCALQRALRVPVDV